MTSTVMLWLQNQRKESGTMDLGGSLTRQDEKDASVPEPGAHIANIGMMLEKMENKIRMTLDTIYFGRTSEIFNKTRSLVSQTEQKKRDDMAGQLASMMKKRNEANPNKS